MTNEKYAICNMGIYYLQLESRPKRKPAAGRWRHVASVAAFQILRYSGDDPNHNEDDEDDRDHNEDHGEGDQDHEDHNEDDQDDQEHKDDEDRIGIENIFLVDFTKSTFEVARNESSSEVYILYFVIKRVTKSFAR